MASVRLTGQEQFSRPRDHVAAKLSQASFIAACLPEANGADATDDHALLSIEPQTTMLPGRVQVELTVVQREGNRTQFRIVNTATGASATADAVLTFLAIEDELTQVEWAVEVVKVTGLLRMMPSSVLRSGMERAIPHVWQRLHARL